MPKLIQRYPDGAAGAALLLMRLSSALIALPVLVRLGPAYPAWLPALVPAVLLVFLLLLGIWTRAAALALASALALDLVDARGELVVILLAGMGGVVALGLLGPGAFSIDAHRFGRRVIRLEPRSPERGGVD